MSVSMWSYRPEVCDGGGCPGDCDLCDKPKNMEEEEDTTDYINRGDAIERLSYHTDFVQSIYVCDGEEMLYKQSAIKEISDIPSADVVEVVRCKDCKHIKEEHFNVMPDGYSCELSGLMVEPEHYCSYGERREQ